tara:strand:- start:6581 stop:7027 length:447 start_codon:yes stop_codon:yes gene_type:complete
MTEQTSGSLYKVVHIPKENINTVYPMVKDELEDILRKAENGYYAEDILKYLNENEMQLWIIWDNENQDKKGFVITEIIERPRLKFCSVFIMTGTNRRRWQYEVMKNLIDFAKQNGCKKGISYARKGWTKIFKQYGFKDTHVALEIKLT